MAQAAREAARGLERGPRWSVARVGVDLAIAVGLGAVAEIVDRGWVTAGVVLIIGAFPLHDVLVHGHEAIHGLASRSRGVNALVLWGTHALVGMSGRSHRAFHLDHHRFLGTDDDPERRIHGAGGWLGPVRVVLLSHVLVHRHAWRSPHTRAGRAAMGVDLCAAALLHAALVAAVGPRAWATYLVLPAMFGLPPIAALRALTEHLAPRPTDLASTRATAARRVGQLGWSNIDHHVEHHLCPQVPWHALPALRARLAPLYAQRGVEVDHGLFRTAFRIWLDGSAGH